MNCHCEKSCGPPEQVRVTFLELKTLLKDGSSSTVIGQRAFSVSPYKPSRCHLDVLASS